MTFSGGPPGQRSIRVRLLLLALLPLGVVLPVLLAVLAIWGGDHIDRLLIAKVRADLAVAHGYYERVAEGVGRSVEGLAGSARLAGTLAPAAQARMEPLLAGARQELRLDFLYFLDVDRDSAALDAWPALAAARAGKAATETDVFTTGQLALLGPQLAEQARTPLLATANAAPDQRAVEDRGLVIHAAAPVHDGAGRLVGVLAGGVLLNKNLAFIDRLNEV
ncbi:MAG: two-component sensor histidine kinase, partial [Betaproteobacteria bacterium]